MPVAVRELVITGEDSVTVNVNAFEVPLTFETVSKYTPASVSTGEKLNCKSVVSALVIELIGITLAEPTTRVKVTVLFVGVKLVPVTTIVGVVAVITVGGPILVIVGAAANALRSPAIRSILKSRKREQS